MQVSIHNFSKSFHLASCLPSPEATFKVTVDRQQTKLLAIPPIRSYQTWIGRVQGNQISNVSNAIWVIACTVYPFHIIHIVKCLQLEMPILEALRKDQVLDDRA